MPPLLAVLAALPFSGQPTTARAVRELTADAPGRWVRLAGVVTHANPHLGDFFLQDATAGVYVGPSPAAALAAGDRVEVVGRAGPGAFAPWVDPAAVRKVGTAPLPDPFPFDLGLADARWLDAQFVAAHAVVEKATPWDKTTILSVRSGHRVALVLVPDPVPPGWAAGLVGATVRFRGVCSPRVDAGTGRLGHVVNVFVQSPAAITRVPAAPADPAAPAVGIDDLRRYVPRLGPDGRRVKLAGSVAAVLGGGRSLYLADGRSVAVVRPAAPAPVRVGDRVEAEGDLDLDGRTPHVDRATVRVVGPGPAPSARPRAAEDLLAGADADHLVRVECVIEEVTGGSLAVRGGTVRFTAHGADGWPLPPPGSRVALTGICRPAAGGFALDLRSAADIHLLDPPPPSVPGWVVPVAVGVAGGGLAAAAWVALLRHQVRRRAAAIRAHFEREAALDQSHQQRRRLEAVGRLASGIAHDFNNLLTVIRGNAELLRGEVPPPAAEMADEVRQAADRAADLTRQLLTFARGGPAGAAPLDLASALREAEGLVRRAVGAGVRVTADYAPDLPPVMADRGRLAQVVMNLAANARDAMPEGGELTIRAVRAAGPNGRAVARLTVADAGTGMDDATQARIFEPFFTTKGIGQGTGLGLATVYGIVRDLDGTIGVRSAPGRGTTFTIDLPAAPGGLTAALAPTPSPIDVPRPEPVTLPPNGGCQPPETRPSVAVRTPPPRDAASVLLVDDDDGVRGVSRASLTAAGFRVVPVGRPAEALDLVRADPGRFDLLVTDAAMPGMSGPELVAAARAARDDLRVLVVSGYPRDELPRGDLLRPDDAFLQKPFTPADLAGRARQALATG